LTNVLNEWLNPSEDSSSDETTETQSQSFEQNKAKDTSEAFDELFNS